MTPLEDVVDAVEKLRELVRRRLPDVEYDVFRTKDPLSANAARVTVGYVRGCVHETFTALDNLFQGVDAHHSNRVDEAVAGGAPAGIAKQLPPLVAEAKDDDASDMKGPLQ